MGTLTELVQTVYDWPGLGTALGGIAIAYALASAVLFPRLGLRPPPGTARMKFGVAAAPLLIALPGWVGAAAKGDGMLILPIVLFVLGLCFVASYQVRWEDEGLEESSLFFKRKTRWTEIEARGFEPAGFGIFSAFKKPYRLQAGDRPIPRFHVLAPDYMAGGNSLDAALRARFPATEWQSTAREGDLSGATGNWFR